MNKEGFIRKIKQNFEVEKNTKSYERVKRMAKTISENLYSEDSHFIYELIQNAQDNTYKTKNKSLDFFVYDDGILIKNNEVGFDETNIESICDFNDSTKSKKKALGYIGEKGIGFKSVFAITDQPSIHSNGYRFYFQKDEYIEPYWIDSLDDYVKEFRDTSTTNIYLPYSASFDNKLDIEKKIKDIESVLILFLDNLDQITIHNRGEIFLSVKKESRVLNNQNIVTITSSNKTNEFLILSKEVDCKDTIKEEKREGVKKRKIIIAFPLVPIDDTRLFAFLPTEVKTGLPFLIQADFLLTASRGDILKDKQWNQWLFDEIVDFLSLSFKNLQNIDKYKYLNFLEKQKSNYSFIDGYYQKILEQLKNENLFLNTKNEFVSSSKICILDDYEFMYKYFQKIIYKNYSGEVFSYAHKDFYIPKYLIKKWNINTVNKSEFLKIIGENSDLFSKMFAKDNILFEELLEFIGNDYAVKKYLLRLPIIPIDSDNGIIFKTKEELSDIQLFFKLDDEGVLNNIFPDLKVISNKYQKKLQTILFYTDILGITHPNIIEILKSLENKDDFFKNIENNINLLVYIKNNYIGENQQQIIELLAKIYQFLSKSNYIIKHEYEEPSYRNDDTAAYWTKLYVSSNYLSSKNSIEKIVDKYCTDKGKENIDFISELYLEYDRKSSKKELKVLQKEWVKLFNELKINDDIKLIKERLEMSARDSQYHQHTTSTTLKNIPFIASPSFRSSYDKDYKIIHLEMQQLTKQDSIFLFKKLSVININNDEYSRVSEFYRHLKYEYVLIPWIDTVRNNYPIYIGDEKYKVKDFYLKVDKEIQNLFHQLPEEYILKENNNIDMIFEFTEEPNYNDIIQFINNRQLKDLKQIKILFQYIHSYYSDKKISLNEIPILINDKIEYTTTDKLIWKDGQELKLIELEPFYGSDFKKFFIEQLDIQEKPTIYQFIEHLKTKPKNYNKIFNKFITLVDNLLDDGYRPNLENEQIFLINKKMFSLEEIIFNDENIKTEVVLNLFNANQKVMLSFNKLANEYEIDKISNYSKEIQIDNNISDDEIQKIYILLLNFTWDYVFSKNQKKFEMLKEDKYFVLETKNITSGAFANIILQIDVNSKYVEIEQDIAIKDDVIYLSTAIDGRKKVSEIAKYISTKIDIDFEKIERFYDKVYKLKDYTKTEYYKEESINEPKEEDDKFDNVFERLSNMDRETTDNDVHQENIDTEETRAEKDSEDSAFENFNDNKKSSSKQKKSSSSNEKTNCPECNTEVNSKNLKKHLCNVHHIDCPDNSNKPKGSNDAKPMTITCTICGFIKSEDNLEDHMCKVHNYKCKESKKTSNNKKTICPECNIQLNSKNLENHLCKVHHKNCDENAENTKNNQNEDTSFDLQDAIEGHEEKVDKKDTTIDPSIIKNEDEYRNKIQSQYDENVKKAGMSTKKYYASRKVKVGKKETREFLNKEYRGYCQICGFTFEQKGNRGKYFESFDWLSEKVSKQKVNIIEAGSSLCLCSRCHSGLKYGDFEAKFLIKLESIDFSKYSFDDFKLKTNTIVDNDKVPICYDFVEMDMYKIPIRLLNEDENIFYTEEHFLNFYNLLTYSKG